MANNLVIRSSSAEFLIFERQTHDKGIQVRFENGDLWLTQKAMSELYNCTTDNISLHLKNIYNDYELNKNSTTEEFSVVQKEGNREVKRNILYYNLDAVISVGYRVNSDKAIQFRRWSTNILKEFSKKGYIIDKRRMENGAFFDTNNINKFVTMNDYNNVEETSESFINDAKFYTCKTNGQDYLCFRCYNECQTCYSYCTMCFDCVSCNSCDNCNNCNNCNGCWGCVDCNSCTHRCVSWAGCWGCYCQCASGCRNGCQSCQPCETCNGPVGH